MTFLSDVEKLKTDPSLETKQHVTEKIAQYYNQGIFDEEEAKIALEVINLLARDAEVQIRKTLSENLKKNQSIPHDLAMRLAQDVAVVAVPMLEFSTLLTQEDLISIVKSSKEVASLSAIAARPDVTKPLSGALIETSHEKVVHTLMDNKKAEVTEEHLREVLQKFSKSGTIIDALVNRGSLPPSIVESMFEVVSEEIKKHLIQQYNLPQSVATEIVNDSHEQTTLNLLSVSDNNRIIQGLVDHLFNSQKLTQSIVLRALCKGDFTFFELGLAKLANTAADKAHNILYNAGYTEFTTLYKKADMPEGALAAVNVIWRFALDEINHGTFNKATYANRMIEYITTNGYDKKISIMPYFMILIQSKIPSDDNMYDQ